MKMKATCIFLSLIVLVSVIFSAKSLAADASGETEELQQLLEEMLIEQRLDQFTNNNKQHHRQSSINDEIEEENDEDISYSHDIAVKLKRGFGDDLVSDLFAASYDIEKVSRVEHLGESDLYHFKLKQVPHHQNPETKRRRVKRNVESKIEALKRDDRVEYALPQKFLKRQKRSTNFEEWMLEEKTRSAELRGMKKQKQEQHKRKMSRLVKDIAHLIKNKKQQGERGEAAKSSTTNKVVEPLPSLINFNDNGYSDQWYLIDRGQRHIPLLNDMNVKNAWLNGWTGKNVSIVIVDDGLDHEHPDFLGKYRADLSYDLNDESDLAHDPMPGSFDSNNNHGTRCAGAAAANANNSVCGVGVAYNADIAAIRVLDGPITDLIEAKALSYKSAQVDIRSASWGPKDDGAHMEYPGKLVNLALEDGVINGRRGKGTLFVWASGNGGANGDDCSCDGYVSHWNIISIGSVNHLGMRPFFMELCPSTMAVVYSGGRTKTNWDVRGGDPGVRVVTSDVRGKCTKTFQGTSAAAPLAAGAFALVLEANPDLTYRDVMHLIARTARIPNKEDTHGWQVNGAGYHVNDKYGFGVLDVSYMLQQAQTWKNVKPRQKCVIEFNDSGVELPLQLHGPQKDRVELTMRVRESDCPAKLDELEHTIANISFSHARRGDVKMRLISPMGTQSEILSYRKNDKTSKGIKFFPFMTLFNWGESPYGKWKLIVESKESSDSNSGGDINKMFGGQLESFSLTLFGLEGKTKKNKKTSNAGDEENVEKRFAFDTRRQHAFVPTESQVVRMYEGEIILMNRNQIVDKRILDSKPELREMLKTVE